MSDLDYKKIIKNSLEIRKEEGENMKVIAKEGWVKDLVDKLKVAAIEDAEQIKHLEEQMRQELDCLNRAAQEVDTPEQLDLEGECSSDTVKFVSVLEDIAKLASNSDIS